MHSQANVTMCVRKRDGDSQPPERNLRVVPQKRPPGDLEYCLRTRNRSPRETRWEFHDNTV